MLRVGLWFLVVCYAGFLCVCQGRAVNEDNKQAKENHRCEYEQKNYTLSEDIPTPSKPCYKCKCNYTWDENSPNSEVCDVVECPWREYDLKYYSKGCQPVYGPTECCPVNWNCPQSQPPPSSAGVNGTDVLGTVTVSDELSRHIRELGNATEEYSSSENATTTPDDIGRTSPTESGRELSELDHVTEMTPAPNCGQDVKCPWHQWGHYAERGCQPYYLKNDCCPAGFKCPPIPVGETFEADCEFGGNFYRVGETVRQSSPCQTCSCIEVPGSGPPRNGIHCEQRKPCGAKIPPGCIPLFKSHDPCCPSDYHCRGESVKAAVVQVRNKAEDENEVKCVVNGRPYVEGQIIINEDNPCIECVCDGNYTGQNSSSCTRIDHCFMSGRKEMKRGCIPIYYQGGCCPIEWHCPQKPVAQIEGELTDMCLFDGRSYPIGSGLDIGQQCVSCTCSTPPDFTCVHRKCEESPNRNCTTVYKDGECCPHYQCGSSTNINAPETESDKLKQGK